MLKKLKDIIVGKKLFSKGDKLLLACSGGCDSTTLAYALMELKLDFAIAHVNFKLRGRDSELDQKFCKVLAKKFGKEFFSISLPAQTLASKKKISIQMAARELRYKWFDELMKREGFTKLVTAHHLNDNIETFFIHLIRGSGVKGLKGMELKRRNMVRPMLAISRKEIESYCEKNKIKFRNDKSNEEDKYERNFIRLKILPQFEKINKGFEKVMASNLEILNEENEMLKELMVSYRNEMVKESPNGILIDKNKLSKLKYKKSFLHFVLAEFGFNNSQIGSLLQNIEEKGLSGKKFMSPTHSMAVDRETIQIKKIAEQDKEFIFRNVEEVKLSGKMKYGSVKKFTSPKQNELFLGESKLHFPFTLRNCKEGDRFVPFGMKGSKLLSDFFKDCKIPTLERKEVKVLENGKGDIIWVIGLRSDERYRVGQKKEKLVKLEYIG